MFILAVIVNFFYLFDGYLWSPLMNIGMLVVMELAGSMRMQDGGSGPPFQVYRDRAWKFVHRDALLPGDLLVLSGPVRTMPADVVLITGRAVVDEAMLTGEATPQAKHAVEEVEVPLDLHGRHRSSVVFAGTSVSTVIAAEEARYSPVAGAVHAVVLRTGHGSEQGALLLALADAGALIRSPDALKLMAFLGAFAVVSAVAYARSVWETATSFRIVLEVTLILASAFPAEIPNALNTALTAAALALGRLDVTCTEPERIALAGGASRVLLDKTGTITEDRCSVVGIATSAGVMTPPDDATPEMAQVVIGGCHGLTVSRGSVIGDQVDVVAFARFGWTLSPDAGTARLGKTKLKIVRRWHFESETKRSSAIVEVEAGHRLLALTKGAPDFLKPLLVDPPEDFDATLERLTTAGYRVLALAWKPAASGAISREVAEAGLNFAGFLVLSAELKCGAMDAIVELLRGGMEVAISTGDDPRTAAAVAERVHLATKPVRILGSDLEPGFSFEAAAETNSLVITGPCLDGLTQTQVREAARHCVVFARMRPGQKAQVVAALRACNVGVLACGDGMNDVAALREADVGVGLLTNMADATSSGAGLTAPVVGRRGTLTAVVDTLRFGRATLSCVIDQFKQQALLAAYQVLTFTVLRRDHVRMGERQMAAPQFGELLCALAQSWASPRRTLSRERPFRTQFNAYLVLSVLLQFAAHVALFLLVRALVYAEGFEPPPESERVFRPSLMNSAMFVARVATLMSDFCVNYRGAPFMESVRENKTLLVGVALMALVLVSVLGVESDLQLWLFELVPMRRALRLRLGLLVAAHLGACLGAEALALRLLSPRPARARADLEEYRPERADAVEETRHAFGFVQFIKENYKLNMEMLKTRVSAKRLEQQQQQAKAKGKRPR
jgi:cation-transporting ATPase 13A1